MKNVLNNPDIPTTHTLKFYTSCSPHCEPFHIQFSISVKWSALACFVRMSEFTMNFGEEWDRALVECACALIPISYAVIQNIQSKTLKLEDDFLSYMEDTLPLDHVIPKRWGAYIQSWKTQSSEHLFIYFEHFEF